MATEPSVGPEMSVRSLDGAVGQCHGAKNKAREKERESRKKKESHFQLLGCQTGIQTFWRSGAG